MTCALFMALAFVIIFKDGGRGPRGPGCRDMDYEWTLWCISRKPERLIAERFDNQKISQKFRLKLNP